MNQLCSDPSLCKHTTGVEAGHRELSDASRDWWMDRNLQRWAEALVSFEPEGRPWSNRLLRCWVCRNKESAASNDTLCLNWKNGETWKYETSSLSASVASDTTANESRLIKERRPLRDFPAAPRNSQTFLFTRPSRLISWNKTPRIRAAESESRREKGRVAICRCCAETTLAGHPPPER